jgi:hypothetical protein
VRKATVSTAHQILVVADCVLRDGVAYRDTAARSLICGIRRGPVGGCRRGSNGATKLSGNCWETTGKSTEHIGLREGVFEGWLRDSFPEMVAQNARRRRAASPEPQLGSVGFTFTRLKADSNSTPNPKWRTGCVERRLLNGEVVSLSRERTRHKGAFVCKAAWSQLRA